MYNEKDELRIICSGKKWDLCYPIDKSFDFFWKSSSQCYDFMCSVSNGQLMCLREVK